ncbi:hypothetical protein CEP52_004500 [Fusarium oligoseptatum]|uniref:Uncharacterized protein n=1 Tax=Fusarium oligoseptatum TaxID=2604345 RepID=A0A428U3D4_9HYPO|nr:hypothetical protein CEP52_004500 [Fusarium oligoseptatum]
MEGDEEVLDKNEWEKLDEHEALSASSEESHKDTVEVGSKKSKKTPLVIDSDEEDDADSNCDSASTDSYGCGDQSLYWMDTAGRDQRFFRHLPMIKRSLIIR